MKALIAVALIVTAAPAFAAGAADEPAASSQRAHKVCTRVQTRGASRLAARRVCLTEAEWRERLGPDWRIQLSGRNPEDDVEALDMRSREQQTSTYTGDIGSSPR